MSFIRVFLSGLVLPRAGSALGRAPGTGVRRGSPRGCARSPSGWLAFAPTRPARDGRDGRPAEGERSRGALVCAAVACRGAAPCARRERRALAARPRPAAPTGALHHFINKGSGETRGPRPNQACQATLGSSPVTTLKVVHPDVQVSRPKRPARCFAFSR